MAKKPDLHPENQPVYAFLKQHDRLGAFGTRLAQSRRGAGLTQADLGFRIGVRSETVSLWENGGFPFGVSLSRLAEALDVPVSALIPDVAPPARPNEATEELRHRAEGARHAEEMRRRAAIYAMDGDHARAADCRALADLYREHWPRGYPALNIPEGDGAPANVSAKQNFSVTGSSAGLCADMGGR